MADLDPKEASGSTKLVGATADGTETDFIGSSIIDGARSLNVNVANQLQVEGSLVSGAGLTTFTIQADQGMNQTFDTLVSNSGQVGFFYGFKIIFSNERVEFRLEIDGQEAFLLDPDFIEDLNLNGGGNNTGLVRWFGRPSFGEIEFFPPTPIKYENSFLLQTRKTAPPNSIQIEKAIVFYG